MKLRVAIACEVDVPDSSVEGGATPDAIAVKAREICQERVARIWTGWGNSVTVAVTHDAPAPRKGVR